MATTSVQADQTKAGAQISTRDGVSNKVQKQANKINYWALFGLIFVTLGIVGISIATCGLNQIAFFSIAVVTLDQTLGIGAISAFIGTLAIFKAIYDKKRSSKDSNPSIELPKIKTPPPNPPPSSSSSTSGIDTSASSGASSSSASTGAASDTSSKGKTEIIDPKKFGLTGITNNTVTRTTNTCWLISLMQMLLNIEDLKELLMKKPKEKEEETVFKTFIDDYQKAISEDKEIDVLAIKTFLKDIVVNITDRAEFQDAHEALGAILDFILEKLDTEKTVENKLIQRKFVKTTKTLWREPIEEPHVGIIPLTMPTQIYYLLIQHLKQNETSKLTFLQKIISKEFFEQFLQLITVNGKYEFFDVDDKNNPDTLIKRIEAYFNDQDEHEAGYGTEKTMVTTKRTLRASPNNLFFNIQRYVPGGSSSTGVNLNDVECPFRLELNENYFEDKKSATYELCNFIVFTTGKHYVSYVKKGDIWFECDDDKKVTPLSLETVQAQSKKAYIVHYKKLG